METNKKGGLCERYLKWCFGEEFLEAGRMFWKWLVSFCEKAKLIEKTSATEEQPSEEKPQPHIHKYITDCYFKTDEEMVKLPVGEVVVNNWGNWVTTKEDESVWPIQLIEPSNQTLRITTQDVEMANNLALGTPMEICFPTSEERVKKGWPEKSVIEFKRAMVQSVSIIGRIGEEFQAAIEFLCEAVSQKPKPVHYTYKNALRWKNRKRHKLIKSTGAEENENGFPPTMWQKAAFNDGDYGFDCTVEEELNGRRD
jgi:hypothetical protein